MLLFQSIGWKFIGFGIGLSWRRLPGSRARPFCRRPAPKKCFCWFRPVGVWRQLPWHFFRWCSWNWAWIQPGTLGWSWKWFWNSWFFTRFYLAWYRLFYSWVSRFPPAVHPERSGFYFFLLPLSPSCYCTCQQDLDICWTVLAATCRAGPFQWAIWTRPWAPINSKRTNSSWLRIGSWAHCCNYWQKCYPTAPVRPVLGAGYCCSSYTPRVPYRTCRCCRTVCSRPRRSLNTRPKTHGCWIQAPSSS